MRQPDQWPPWCQPGSQTADYNSLTGQSVSDIAVHCVTLCHVTVSHCVTWHTQTSHNTVCPCPTVTKFTIWHIQSESRFHQRVTVSADMKKGRTKFLKTTLRKKRICQLNEHTAVRHDCLLAGKRHTLPQLVTSQSTFFKFTKGPNSWTLF